MYDEYISSDKFHAYRGDLSKIYQGEDVDYCVEETHIHHRFSVSAV